jgi:hypothetical protein
MTGKGFAIVVKKEGDALSASTEEGHGEIGRYLRHFNNNVSSGGDHPQLINPEAEDLIDFSDDNRSSAQPPHLPQNSAPLQSSAPPQSQQASFPSAGYSSHAPHRYTSASGSYRDYLGAPPSAPFADKPVRIGSSATLPAYLSPAYQQMGSESKDSNSLQSIDPYGRLAYGSSSSAQGRRQQSLAIATALLKPEAHSYWEDCTY